MEGQQFCLRWHNFQNTLLSSLPKLLDGGYLTDVTLSAGGRHIHAHRIILSACSYYFKELFKDLSALQHPVIVLPGMEYANLCALVTFMYNGEVNIYQDQLPALLAMADTLHIRGLADIAGTSSRQDNGMFTHLPPTVGASSVSTTGASSATATATTTTTTASSPSSSSSSVHHVAPTVIPTKQEDGDPKESIRIKEEAKENPESVSSMQFDENLEEDSANEQESVPYCVKTKPYYSINAKLNQREKIVNTSTKLMEKSSYVESAINDIGAEERENPLMDGLKATGNSLDASMRFLTNTASNRSSQGCNKTSVTCLICGKQLSNQYNLRVHMETHSNSSYSCTACSHVSRSRDALRKHVSYRHPVAAPQKRSRYSSSKS